MQAQDKRLLPVFQVLEIPDKKRLYCKKELQARLRQD